MCTNAKVFNDDVHFDEFILYCLNEVGMIIKTCNSLLGNRNAISIKMCTNYIQNIINVFNCSAK